MVNMLMDEKVVVDALEREFHNLLELCRPLVETVPDFADVLAPYGEGSYVVVGKGVGDPFGQHGLRVRETGRLSHDVAALVNESSGFTLVRLGEPRIALRVTERLLTSAFVGYLR